MRKVVVSLFLVVAFLAVSCQVFALTPEPQKGQKIERFTGRVTSVNVAGMQMVVESMTAGMTFEIGGAKLTGYRTIDGIREGDRVTVQYLMSRGKATARTITKNKSYRGK